MLLYNCEGYLVFLNKVCIGNAGYLSFCNVSRQLLLLKENLSFLHMARANFDHTGGTRHRNNVIPSSMQPHDVLTKFVLLLWLLLFQYCLLHVAWSLSGVKTID